MTDAELLAWFERPTLAPRVFGHREHVRLTWLCLARYGRAETERRLLTGLSALAAQAGTPGTFNAPLTLAWIDRIDRARAALGDHTFDDLLRCHPALLDRGSVRATTQAI